MPTLPHLLTLLAFLYILILNQTCHQKATVLQYHATVVWMCPQYPVKFKNCFCCRGRQKYFPEKYPTIIKQFLCEWLLNLGCA